MSTDCNDSERAKIGRVHKRLAIDDNGPATGSVADRDVIAFWELPCSSIITEGTAKIEQVTLLEHYHNAAFTETNKDVIIHFSSFELITNTDNAEFTLDDIDGELENYLGFVKITTEDFVKVDNINVAQMNNLNLNIGTAADSKTIWAYLVADEIQTINANAKYKIIANITKD